MCTAMLDRDVLNRLLNPADPALRAKVLTDLLDHPQDHPVVKSTRARIHEQPWVKATLAAHNGDGSWGRNGSPRGA